MPSMIGLSISHYRILEEIGRGGMGVVYRARDENLPRDVAVKLLPPGTLKEWISTKRVRQEALALARLNHPAVTVLHDLVSTPEYDCIVMEFVLGESLDAIVRRGAQEEHEVLRLGVQLAHGLAAVHAAGIIHRDLKPGNLRVTPDGWLKILDFGLAKRTIPDSEIVSSTTRVLVGTPPYMAPEVWGGAPASESSDLYATGVVLYEMSTGVHPFQDVAEKGFAYAALNLDPPPPRGRIPAISPEFEAAILRCMEKDPARRMPAAKELARVLEALHARQPSAREDVRTRARKVPGPWWLVGAGITLTAVVVLAVGMLLGWWGRPAPIRSIAVLPFVTFSGEAGQEDVADGVTDGLISKLGEYSSLRVICRTSMMTYKNQAKTVPSIARELGVEGVVQGSVRVTRGRVNYSFQLIRARDERQLLNERYEGDLSDTPDIQNRVANAIVHKIHLPDADADRTARLRESTVDPAAYRLYLQGRFSWNRRSEEGVRQAIECFTLAIGRDSMYAPAYSGLADAWTTAGHLGMATPLDAYPRAKQAVLRALAIDSTLSEAYVSLANIRQNFDWDWEGAERDYLRAIELNGNNSVAHHWYANLLTFRGEFERATTEIKKAKELDPLSLPINIGAAAVLYFARRHEEAFWSYRVVTQIDSTSGLLYRAMAANLYQMRRETETARAIQRWLDLQYPGDLARRTADAYRSARFRGMMRVLLGALAAKRQAGGYEPATHLAELSILLGDREAALHWLAVAFAEHDSELNRLKVDPLFDPLREDPRFQVLLRGVGLGSPV